MKRRHKNRRKHKKKKIDKIKFESESEEIDERNKSISTIRNISKSIRKSKSKSNSKINNKIEINSIKSEIDNDSDATIILTAENRHKYNLGKL